MVIITYNGRRSIVLRISSDSAVSAHASEVPLQDEGLAQGKSDDCGDSEWQ